MPDVLVRSVMSLYEGAKTRVRVDCELSEVKWECTKDLCCHLFFMQWWYIYIHMQAIHIYVCVYECVDDLIH